MAMRKRVPEKVVITQTEINICARLGLTVEDFARSVLEERRDRKRRLKAARDKRLVQATAGRLAKS